MKNKKPKYEAPVLIPLGELARGTGMPPPSGQRNCKAGPDATGNCGAGTNFAVAPPPNCRNGSQAANRCASGASVV